MQYDIDSVLTVSQLTRQIKRNLEGEFTDLWVGGEISNYVRHSSGHHYFTIKDDGSELPCAMWRSTAAGIKLRLKNGMDIIVSGDISVYEPRGRYQFIVRWIIEKGVGQLELKFRELKDRLQREGLFADEYKKPVPQFPRAIGLVTSETGAAVRDMINVLRRRMPSCRIVLCPVAVQGDGAAVDVARGVRLFNVYRDVDLMIVGRGGGSMEDLWAFNEEVVARAIFKSEIPVISAVGHEVDFTIADFVADMRAPTPSAAAELAVPDYRDVLSAVNEYRRRMTSSVVSQSSFLRERLERLSSSYVFRRPERIFESQKQQVDELSVDLARSMSLRAERLRGRLESATGRLGSLSPKGVLKRGYAICRTHPEGMIVRSPKDVAGSKMISVELAEGTILSMVDSETL